MSALAEVRRRAVAGEPVPRIAQDLGLPLDLAEQMVGHWQRLGKLTVLRVDGAAGCADADSLRCAGCFFASQCPARE